MVRVREGVARSVSRDDGFGGDVLKARVGSQCFLSFIPSFTPSVSLLDATPLQPKSQSVVVPNAVVSE